MIQKCWSNTGQRKRKHQKPKNQNNAVTIHLLHYPIKQITIQKNQTIQHTHQIQTLMKHYHPTQQLETTKKKTTRRRIKRYRLHKSTKKSNESIEDNA